MLLTVDVCEDLIYVEGVTMTLVLAFQSHGVHGSKIDAPQADTLVWQWPRAAKPGQVRNAPLTIMAPW